MKDTESPERSAVIAPFRQQDSSNTTTAHYLARRLHVALNDLGFRPHIPSDWPQPSPEGLSFRSLSVREAEKFILAVEDLALGRLSKQA